MVTISYNVKGADQIIRELNNFRLDALEGAIDKVMDEMANDAAVYPPPTGGKYQRTGDLGRGWTDGETMFPRSEPTMIEALRENSVSYGPYVQGAEDQAEVHQGRWKTVDDLMSSWEDRVAGAIEDALDRLLPQ
jgi:hypothetical protein